MAHDERKIFVDCCLSIIAVLVCAGITTYLQLSQNINSGMELASITQIYDDWSVAPLIEIDTDDHSCPTGTNPIWSKVWAGTVQGCDCTNVMFSFYGLKVDDRCIDDNERYCNYVHPLYPVLQTELNNMYICGKRGGEPFARAVRPNSDNQCPDGYTACSQNTNMQNTICYNNQDGADTCPITAIEFVDVGDVTSFIDGKQSQSPSEVWQSIDFDDE